LRRDIHVYLGSLFVSKAVGFDIVIEPMAKSYIYIYEEPMTVWPTDNNGEAFLVGIFTFSL
jgi:hypothetical protein